MATQALYGCQIAHPRWSKERLVDEAIKLTDLMIKKLDKKKKRKTV